MEPSGGRSEAMLDDTRSTSATTAPQPAMPLEYEPPRRAGVPGLRMQLWLGIFASVFMSAGIGFGMFGMLMATGLKDDHAGPIGFGVGCFMLGVCLVGLMIWVRRPIR